MRLSTVLDLKKSSLAEEVSRKKDVGKTVKALEKQVSEKASGLEKLQLSYDKAKQEVDAQSAEVDGKEELLSTLQTGVASREGQQSGYQGQLSEARNRATTAGTEQEQAKLKINHLEKRVKEDEPRAKKAMQQNVGLVNGLESLRKQASKLENDLTKLGFRTWPRRTNA